MSETNIRANQIIGTISTKDHQVESTLAFGGWALCLYPSSYSSDYRDSYPPTEEEGVAMQQDRRQRESSLRGLLQCEKRRQALGRRRVWQICRGEREFAEGDEQPAVNLRYHHTTGCPKRAGLLAGSPCGRGGFVRQRAA